jgi:hypothetical protein
MDKYYADSGKTSKWIVQMRKLSTDFSAIFVNLDKIDWSLAEKNQLFLKIHKKQLK